MKWNAEMLALAVATGVEVGPEKFGLPTGTKLDDVIDNSSDRCLLCEFLLACHRGWRCPDPAWGCYSECLEHSFPDRKRKQP